MRFNKFPLVAFFITVCIILIVVLFIAQHDSEPVVDLEFSGVSNFNFHMDNELMPPSVSFDISLYFHNPSTVTVTVIDADLHLVLKSLRL